MAEQLLKTSVPNKNIKKMITGTPLSSVYADEVNNIIQFESVMYQNDRRMPFQNTASGAENVFQFDNSDQFLGQVWIEMEVGIAAGGNDADLIHWRSDYPAYDYIKKITWKVGSTNEYTIPKEVLLDFIHEQCETDIKKAKLHDFAGSKYVYSKVAGKLKLYALIPLPWSTMKASKIGNGQKPFPTHALGNQRITLRITMEKYSDLFLPADGSRVIAPANGGVPSKLDLCYKIAKVAFNDELKMGKLEYAFRQAIGGESITLKDQTSHIVDLKGFQSGELCQIMFHVQDKLDTAGKSDPFKGNDIYDIEVKYKGTTVYKANARNGFVDLLEQNGSNEYGLRTLSEARATTAKVSALNELSEIQAGETSVLSTQNFADSIISYYGFVSVEGKDVKDYYYVIPFSEIRMQMLESFSQYAIGTNLENVDLRLEFKSKADYANKVLHVCHVYNGIYTLEELNGSTVVKCAL